LDLACIEFTGLAIQFLQSQIFMALMVVHAHSLINHFALIFLPRIKQDQDTRSRKLKIGIFPLNSFKASAHAWHALNLNISII
jgi:hypothetical protein